jgi:hypothetical protein
MVIEVEEGDGEEEEGKQYHQLPLNSFNRSKNA